MHPAWLRCSSVAYTRYAPSSRLARQAPRRPGRLVKEGRGSRNLAHLFLRQGKPGGGGRECSHLGNLLSRAQQVKVLPGKVGHQPEASLAWQRGNPSYEA